MAMERNLQRSVLAWLKNQGALTRKRHGSAFGVAGDPDVYGVYRGIHFEIELKKPGESPTVLQRARLAEWAAAGAVCGVVHSMPELREFWARLTAT